MTHHPLPILSPCIGVCAMDEQDVYCMGCLRTRDEIAHWSTLAPHERARIMEEELPLRECEAHKPSR